MYTRRTQRSLLPILGASGEKVHSVAVRSWGDKRPKIALDGTSRTGSIRGVTGNSAGNAARDVDLSSANVYTRSPARMPSFVARSRSVRSAIFQGERPATLQLECQVTSKSGPNQVLLLSARLAAQGVLRPPCLRRLPAAEYHVRYTEFRE
ncbi:MAG: hypothetical protein IPK82_20610 [Polyangiaceae bacterium]|nr:hypothetical protein [Polyangiaceae bacterium]